MATTTALLEYNTDAREWRLQVGEDGTDGKVRDVPEFGGRFTAEEMEKVSGLVSSRGQQLTGRGLAAVGERVDRYRGQTAWSVVAGM